MSHLTIRKIRKADIPVLHGFRIDSSFRRFCTMRKSRPTVEEFAAELQRDFDTDRQVQFMVELDGRPIGTIWVYGMDERLNLAYISTFLAPDFRNLGYGVYSHCRVLQFMFEEVKIATMMAEVYQHNTASLRAMRRHGWREIADSAVDVENAEAKVGFKCSYEDFLASGIRFAANCELCA